MRPIQMSWGKYQTQIVELKGGINENISSLELQAGELIDVKNYMITEGGYGGYRSIAGFERFDGKTLPSQYQSYVFTLENCSNAVSNTDVLTGDTSGATATALADGLLVSGTYLGGDATVIVQARIDSGTYTDEAVSVGATPIGDIQLLETITGGTDDYNEGIAYARSIVAAVPGEGRVLGVHVFESKIYAFRKKSGVNEIGFYVEDGTSGWTEIGTAADPIVYSGTYTDHQFYFTNYNFSASATGLGFYWCDGVNQAREYIPASGVATISNPNVAADIPIRIRAHNNYLFLAYAGGSLQYSELGLPNGWNPVNGAGEIAMGREITNLVQGVQGTLVIFLDEGLRILKGIVASDFSLETFSDNTGGYDRTARRLLGTIFFIDDRGLTTLDASDQFGDYAANSISQRFKQTLQLKSEGIVTTTTRRDLNQYRIYFDDRTGIIVSFEGKEFRGATFFEYPLQLRVAAQGEDTAGKDLIVGAMDEDTGYVYKLDSGYSFDSTPITCRLTTAFYHYGSPRNWKTFKRATLEIAGDTDQEFDIKVDFDYNEPGTARSIWDSMQVYTVDGSAIYGESKWGIMKYGTASSVTNRVPVYIMGIGVNMSYKVISNEAYRPQHIIQNIITDFEINSRRM